MALPTNIPNGVKFYFPITLTYTSTSYMLSSTYQQQLFFAE